MEIQNWYLLTVVLGGIGVLILNHLHRVDGGYEEEGEALFIILAVAVPVLNLIVFAYSQRLLIPRIVKALDRFLSKKVF